MTRCIRDLYVFISAFAIATIQVAIIPLYKVVRIHGSVGWKSMPFTRSERAKSCLLTSNLMVYVGGDTYVRRRGVRPVRRKRKPGHEPLK
jgi:hypothetical protein